MDPVLYCLEKVLRMGNESLYDTGRGSRATFLKNEAHLSQCPLVAVIIIVETPLEFSSAAEQKLSQK